MRLFKDDVFFITIVAAKEVKDVVGGVYILPSHLAQ